MNCDRTPKEEKSISSYLGHAVKPHLEFNGVFYFQSLATIFKIKLEF